MLIHREPNSRITQPDATRSAKHPLNEAVDKPIPKPKPVTTPEEAKELLRNCQETAKAVNGTAKAFRRAVCEAYVQGALKVLKLSDKGFCLKVSMGVTNNRHRSTLNRLCLAAAMDAKYKLPPGEVNESALRMCRTKVPVDKRGDVLAHARKKKGSYGKITAWDIQAAAKELGCLKPSDPPPPAKAGEPVRDVEASCERSANSDVKAAVRRTTPQDDTTSSNVAETREETFQALFQEYSKHQNALQRLLKKFDIQPALMQQVTALVKHQRQQLDDLLKKAIG